MNEPDSSWLRTMGQVSSLGLLILISTCIGLGAGLWLDGRLGTKPWLAFVLTVLGLAAGMYESAKILLKIVRDANK